MRSYLNAEELEALRGLPHETRTLYREGLRPYMDYRTRLVGTRYVVDYQALYELLEVCPERGSKRGGRWQPDREKVRNYLRQLERKGLIERRKRPKKTDNMVIFLPLADFDGPIRPDEEPQRNPIERTPKGTPRSNAPETQSGYGFRDEMPRNQHALESQSEKAEEPHPSEYPIKNTITTAAGNSIQLAAEGRDRVVSDWSPSQQVLSDLAGFDVPLWFVQEYLAEFRLYWAGTGRRCQSWDAVLFKHCLRWWRLHGSKWRGAKGRGDDGFIARHFESSWANDLGGA